MEDYLLAYSDRLDEYVAQVSRRWDEAWGFREALPEAESALRESLGRGVIEFLRSQFKQHVEQETLSPDLGRVADPPRYLITKTPSVSNVAAFFPLFPDARLLIIVRDARSLIESGVRSFGWDYEWAMRRWAAAARELLAFTERFPSDRYPYLICRYEDLYLDTETQLKRVAGLLEIDPEKFDTVKLKNLPVRGSSEVRSGDAFPVHWQPQAKKAQFDPIKRWRNWPAKRHQRLAYLAGEEMQRLGYELVEPKENATWGSWRNRLLDIKWRVRTAVFTRLGRNVVKSFSLRRWFKEETRGRNVTRASVD
jgi:hypothetical protein